MTPAVRKCTVEFVGIPGAGKTTIARCVVTLLRAKSVPVLEPVRRISPEVPRALRLMRKAVICGAAASPPSLFVRTEASVLRSHQPTARDYVARSVQIHTAQRLLQRASRWPGTTLLDEGLLQALWSTGLRGTYEPLLRHLSTTTAWTGPDVVVVVTTPVEDAWTRLTNRSSLHSRTQQLAAERQLVELRRGETLVAELVSWFRSRAADGTVITVSGTGSPELRAVEIVRQLCSPEGR